MSDDLFDLGDIPVPPEQVEAHGIQDKFDYDVAFHFAFCGVGQCGGRLAEAFGSLGYARVCAVNTAIQDLGKLDMTEDQKLDVGGSGAGKDPAVAAAAIADKDEEVYDLLKRNWGDEVDYAFVCLGTGGGTGAGAMTKVIEVAKRFLAETKRPVKVGAIIALPKLGEGWRPAKNTLAVCRELSDAGVSPIIILDNEKIDEIYPRLAIGDFYKTGNTSISKYLHLFNRLAAQDSDHVTFDRADFGKLLDSGVVAFGAQQVKSWGSEADISKAIREQLKGNILAAVDLTKGLQAGLIFVCGSQVIATVPQAILDHGFEMLNRILSKDSTVYRGVYEGGPASSLLALSLVGQLPWPHERIMDLANKAGVDETEIDWLGV